MCIACKLVNKEIPRHTVFEDNDLIVILDAFPYSKGHLLIIPKDHHENLVDLSDDLVIKVGLLSKKLVGILKDALEPEAVIIMQNNYELNSLKHYHYHLIPHYKDSDLLGLYDTSTHDRNDFEYLSELADRLAKLI